MAKFLALVIFALLLALHWLAPAASLGFASMKLVLAVSFGVALLKVVQAELEDIFNSPRISSS